MNHSTQLRLVADIMDRLLPAYQHCVCVRTHPTLSPIVEISEVAFREMFAGKSVERERIGAGTFVLKSEMCGVRFHALEYADEAEKTATVLI